MNKVFLMGRITKDLELSKSKSGAEYCKFTLAVARENSKEHETDFIECVAFNKTAETISKYTEKGNRIIVEGSLQLNSYEDKEKNKKTSTTIIINNFYFIDYRKNDQEKVSEDELPF